MTTALLGGLLASGGVVAAATPAQAAFDCNSNVCLWQDINYSGPKWNFSPRKVDNVGSANDQATSLHNRINRQTAFYTDAHQMGYKITLQPGMSVNNLSSYILPRGIYPWWTNWNDEISSYITY
ncbi:hypothetical protein GCM10009595_08850 [Falsarthrobacter nasiphocae]